MAASEDDFSLKVQEFLDNKFGEDVDKLEGLPSLIQKKYKYAETLKQKIAQCTEEAKANKRNANSAGRVQAQHIEQLLEEKVKIDKKTNSHLSKNVDCYEKLKQLNQDIEQVNCVQVYLSWLMQVIHLSSELKNELLSGHLEVAVEFFNTISDVAKRISKSKCQNLVDYMNTSNDYWLKALSDTLSREMDAILIKMKWPFATGISSPMMIEKNNEEIMPKFDSIGRLLLKMNPSINEMGEKLGLDKRLMLTEVLVKPLQKRFSFHFYGSRRTNNIEKPEWYFTQILNWIRDHSPFLENYVQPIADKEGFQNHYIQHEFIKALVETATEKVKSSLSQIMANESLFSHLVDEIILFDTELRSIFDYPKHFVGCTWVLLAQPYLDNWIYLEEKRGTTAIDQFLSQSEAFTSKFDDFGTESNSKVPYSVENIITLISLITEKYKGFKDTEAQLKFVDLQLHLLAYLVSKLQDLSTLESTLFDHKVMFAILNGCQFIDDVLHEWTDEVFFIQLHCLKSQSTTKEFSKKLHQISVRLDDSVTEDSGNDVSIECVGEQQNSFLEHGLFDDVINSNSKLMASIMEKVLINVEKDFLKKLESYIGERWHCMPASQDIVTQMLSSSACSLLMDVKETLQTMQNELCSTAFNKLWQKYAKMADSRIYNKLILANHFNEGGASQLKFDMMKNLFVLFEEYTSKPDSFFKMAKESCILLNLLPGSAVLLRELLTSPKENKANDEISNSLSEIGVKNISPECALRILNSRVDWPKI